MKAVKIGSPASVDSLQVVDIDDPGQPGAGQLRVRIHASSLNFHDYGVVSGVLPAEAGRIPMADGAGVVEAIGAGVDGFKAGDHVVSCFFPFWENGPPAIGDFTTTPGDGVDGYAREVVVLPSQYFTHAPQGYSHAESATLTTAGLTAWRALVVDGQLKAGATVLVLGTGGVSIFGLQLARAMGASVIATSSSDAKLEKLRALGADHTINYRDNPEWGKEVRSLTGGRGVDHVIEVGGPGHVAAVDHGLPDRRPYRVIGVLTGRAGPVPTAALMARQQRLQGLIVGSRQDQRDMIRALEVTASSR